MQKHVAANGAESHEPSWYLARGDKQYGPLTDRELSLLAEGGNFREDDLLWTEGLDSWKPAHTVFDLAPSPKADAAMPPQPTGDVVDALVQAFTTGGEKPKSQPTLKDRVLDEIKKFAAIFVYLWIVLIVLLIHEWIVLAENHISFRFYGLAAINAIVLGKVMLLAEHWHFAEELKGKPLIYPIVYKSVAFTTLLFAAYFVEEMLLGLIAGRGLFASFPSVGGGSFLGALSLWLIFCVALIPFFAFKEIERAIGQAEFRILLFGKR
ncbi:MAG: DUF4339 domain-containing protein [Methyloceanibacter sp.]|uniref:DUF4339 domain-containing protein n=1 Tax=Methyloceanibacter sp. TaxID=1965321 RepID=UPI003D6D3F36